MSFITAPAELLYRGINRARRALYRQRLLKPGKLPRPVISVGGIGTGGAGKTPAVITVCRFLESAGLRVAVLTRGYGRRNSQTDGIVTSFDADNFGDEPVLIKRSISGDVIVGARRYENAMRYLAHNTCDVFVLDDGFQHLQLARNFDLVIDAPASFHREGRSALSDADAVIPRRLRTIVPDDWKGRPLFAFAGLADNEQFFASLRDAGATLTGVAGFPDHHLYSPADLARMRRDAGGATIVTTCKDKVKINDPDILAANAEMQIDQEVLDQILTAARGERRRRKRRKNPFVQRAEYLVYKVVSGLVARMSEESVYRWGTRLGALAGKVVRKRDRLGMRNLRHVFPERSEKELRRILNESWRHFGREMLLYLKLRDASAEEIASRCLFVNEQLVKEAIDRGKGTMLMSGHWGGWEIGGLAVMSLIGRVRTVARPLDNELLEADMHRLRQKTGTEVVDRRRAARSLLRALSENGVVILLPDQAVQPREGVLVPFLGQPAWTTNAPARMALRANSTIVFGFCIPDGLRHRLEFTEAIRADLLQDEERDPVNLTKRLNDVISARITARPELYLWMHDRWKGTRESDVTNVL